MLNANANAVTKETVLYRDTMKNYSKISYVHAYAVSLS